MMKKRRSLGNHFANKVLDDYMKDTENELFNSREELIENYSRDENYEKLFQGDEGKNLTHTYRAVVFMNTKDWAEFITDAFLEYCEANHPQNHFIQDIAKNIVLHVRIQAECQYRLIRDRNNIPTQSQPLRLELNYDLPAIFNKNVKKETDN